MSAPATAHCAYSKCTMENPRQAHLDQDRDVIDISAEHECTFWTAKFGVTYEELKRAVARVGPRVSQVRALLEK